MSKTTGPRPHPLQRRHDPAISSGKESQRGKLDRCMSKVCAIECADMIDTGKIKEKCTKIERTE